jgi:hypothetical protein
MNQSKRPAGRPQPEDYKTRAEYRWARKQWIRKHGGSLFGTLAIAIFFGALTGSQLLMFLLIAFAIVGTVIARSRP